MIVAIVEKLSRILWGALGAAGMAGQVDVVGVKLGMPSGMARLFSVKPILYQFEYRRGREEFKIKQAVRKVGPEEKNLVYALGVY